MQYDIPEPKELREMFKVNMQEIIKKIVGQLKIQASRNVKHATVCFSSNELTVDTAKEIVYIFKSKGYNADYYRDTSYGNEGYTFTITWN